VQVLETLATMLVLLSTVGVVLFAAYSFVWMKGWDAGFRDGADVYDQAFQAELKKQLGAELEDAFRAGYHSAQQAGVGAEMPGAKWN